MSGDVLARLRRALVLRRNRHRAAGRMMLAAEVDAIIKSCDTLARPEKAPRLQG